MCTSTMWRFDLPESIAALKGINLKGLPWKNGGLVFSKKRTDLIEWLSALFKGNLDRLQEIPCGQCLECRMSKSREMTQRAFHEASYYKDNWFLTLTYDDQKLKDEDLIKSINPVTFQSGIFININMHEVSDFLKRLRSRIAYKTGHLGVRAVYCSEYGPLHGRAHYHVNLFNCPIPDLKVFKKEYVGGKSYFYYTSDIVSECWGHGNIVLVPFCYETAAYVSRYILKKQNGKNRAAYEEACQVAGVQPMHNESVQYPTRPGLGRQFYEDNRDLIYEYDGVILPNGHQAKPARYYDKLFDLDHPEEMEKIRASRRRVADLVRFNKLKAAKLQNSDQLAKIRGLYLRQRLKKLPRQDL